MKMITRLQEHRGLTLLSICFLLGNRLDAFTANKPNTFSSPTYNSHTIANNRINDIPLRMVQEPVAVASEKNPLASLLNIFNKGSASNVVANDNERSLMAAEAVVKNFVDALNARKQPADLITFFTDSVEFTDDAFYKPIIGYDELLKHFYLHAGSSSLSTSLSNSNIMDVGKTIVIDELATKFDRDENDGDMIGKVFVLYHLQNDEGSIVPDSKGITYYTIDVEDEKITSMFDVHEPSSPKPGNGGLKLLKNISPLLEKNSNKNATPEIQEGTNGAEKKTVVEKYFESWSARDINQAIELFTEDCVLQDTQYAGAFNGKNEIFSHLTNVEECLPKSFDFIVDEVVTVPSSEAGTKEKIAALWHVENGGEPLSFTRGCSFYATDAKSGLIKSGIEIPEKAPPKQGLINTLKLMFDAEPVRLIPAALWVAYMVIVFFSDGILPGANALQLEERTWIEVRDLSINFFLVSPLLNLPFSPTVHPMLEGVFNLLLSWAAMFAGFLSDDRKDKPNLLPFGPIVIGMQFLTSAFLLPYLALRSEERTTSDKTVYKEDISGSIQATVSEWRPLGAFLGTVGTSAIVWAFMGRPEFGNLSERYCTFIDLLSIDRVGSSFLVDLVVFALFQSWFVDDDLQRRGVNADDLFVLRNVAKFVPFFGLAAYLSLRPELPSREDLN